jgi:hypothetical protein
VDPSDLTTGKLITTAVHDEPMPAAEGTEVRHGSAQYYMYDWFANILSVIGLHEALNKDAKWRFPQVQECLFPEL